MGKVLTFISITIALITIGVPILMSEFFGGWTKKYTSGVYFRPSKHIPDQSGKVAIVTGANTGIGYETALELAKAGTIVFLAARNEAKGKAAQEKIQAEVGKHARVQFLPLDLSSFKSISKFAQLFLKFDLPLDMLVLNAGVMMSPGKAFLGKEMHYGFDTTEEGFESHIGVNHIGHAYLTKLLLKRLERSSPSRIVSVSSAAEMSAPDSGMEFKTWWNPKDGKMPALYEDGKAYGQSKLANVMYTKELAQRLNGTGVTAYSCHPGVIRTELTRHLTAKLEGDLESEIQKSLFALFYGWIESSNFDVAGGALTQLYLTVAPEEDLVNGAFYHPVGKLVTPTHPQAANETLSKMLWEETETAIKMKSNYKFQN